MKLQKYNSFINEAKDNKEEKAIKDLLKKVDKKGILSFQTVRGETWHLAITYDSNLELYSLKYVNKPYEATMAMGTIFSITSSKMDKTESVVVLVENALGGFKDRRNFATEK